MILTVFAGDTTYHALSGAALGRLIDELTSSGSGRDSGVAGRPERGVFATFILFVPHRDPMESDQYFDSCLQVSVNSLTGYGALRWLIPEGSEVRMDQDIARSVWISKNAEPPISDPKVVADLSNGRLFEPRSVLPVSDIRAAIEEFCELRTGQRPGAVCWDRDDSDRYCSTQPDTTPPYCEDPWCRISGTRHPFH
ncbi:Imm1 family immunity protein [Streptomyces lonegramiae]|uniref:Imm1 family immunity protein n=1 Tax=Streptomyces lonegramiae TaxID=3075524 RepID=UPI00374E1E3E